MQGVQTYSEDSIHVKGEFLFLRPSPYFLICFIQMNLSNLSQEGKFGLIYHCFRVVSRGEAKWPKILKQW